MNNLPTDPHASSHPDDYTCGDCQSRNIWITSTAWERVNHGDHGPEPSDVDNVPQQSIMACGDCGSENIEPYDPVERFRDCAGKY